MNRLQQVILDDTCTAWFSAESAAGCVRGRGYAFIGDDFVEGRELVDFVHQRCMGRAPEASIAELRDLIPRLNGCWGLVAQLPDGRTLAATDRLRSVPLFYARCGETVVVSSSAYALLECIRPAAIHLRSAAEYVLAGFVTGNNTLFDGISQLQAGEILEVAPGREPSVQRYYRYLADEQTAADEESLERELAGILDRVFSRYARAFGRRRIVVPLSGGLDSRLVAGMLKRHGAENVLCFSYGLRGNPEAEISRSIAAALGQQWRLVEYNADVWTRCLASADIPRFFDYCANAVSLPHLQDLPAIRQLAAEDGTSRALVMPGHSFDMLAGSHTDPALLGVRGSAGMAPIRDVILRIHYILFPETDRFIADHGIPQWLEEQLAAYWKPDERPASAFYDAWEVDNRQAKFIVNSVRAYEFCRLGWALPLWDYELMDFFAAVPPELKVHQRLHFNTLVSKVFRGDLSKLREIPRNNGQLLTRRITGQGELPPVFEERRFSAPYRALRSFLECTGAMKLLRRLRYTRKPPDPLAFDHWFTRGRHPGKMTLREAFNNYGVQDLLPPAIRRMLAPHTRRVLAQTNSNSPLAVIVLAQHYRKLESTNGAGQ